MELDTTASNYFDQTEVHENVAVQVLINSKTGNTSLAWTRDPRIIEEWRESAQVATC